MTEPDETIETDTGPHHAGPQRQCALTRQVRPVDELIRFVAGPDGLVPDIKRKLPGRGVWVSGQRQAVADAARRGVFKRALKTDLKIPGDLPDMVERLLVRATLDALSIAHKAGQVAAGYVRVETAIAKGGIAGLIHAAEASPDGPRKLAAALARSTAIGDQKVVTIRGFSSAELDLALGRANVVHAALLAGRAGDTFMARWRDLERFRMAEGDGAQRDDIAGSPAPVAEQLGMG